MKESRIALPPSGKYALWCICATGPGQSSRPRLFSCFHPPATIYPKPSAKNSEDPHPARWMGISFGVAGRKIRRAFLFTQERLPLFGGCLPDSAEWAAPHKPGRQCEISLAAKKQKPHTLWVRGRSVRRFPVQAGAAHRSHVSDLSPQRSFTVTDSPGISPDSMNV